MRRHIDRGSMIESGGVVWMVVGVIVLVAALKASDFRTLDNFANLSRQFTVLAVASLAQLVVVVSGGVDLSIATNVRLGSIAAAIAMNGSNGRLLPGILAALGVGLAVGLFNAFIVTRLLIEPFIATIGTGALLGGISLFVASTPQGRSAPALNVFYGWSIGPIFAVVLLVVAIWLLAAWGLRRTKWGPHIYAVGGDPVVAGLSGIPVRTVKASAYVFAGLLGGVAAVITLASAGVGDPAAATGLEFDSLAAVVIGGASLAGGRGRLLGTFGGVVLFSTLGNVFNLMQVNIWYQQLTRGVIILVAASILVVRHSGARRTAGRQLLRIPSTSPNR